MTTEMTSEQSAGTADETTPDGSALVLPRVPRLPIFGILILLLATGLTFLGWHNHTRAAEDDARDRAVSVVVPRVEKLLSYQAASGEQEFAEEKEWLTGTFATEFGNLLTDQVAPAARTGKISAAAKVLADGVTQSAEDQVTLLVFVNVTLTGEGPSFPQVTGSRLRVVAERHDDDWLISQMQPV